MGHIWQGWSRAGVLLLAAVVVPADGLERSQIFQRLRGQVRERWNQPRSHRPVSRGRIEVGACVCRTSGSEVTGGGRWELRTSFRCGVGRDEQRPGQRWAPHTEPASSSPPSPPSTTEILPKQIALRREKNTTLRGRNGEGMDHRSTIRERLPRWLVCELSRRPNDIAPRGECRRSEPTGRIHLSIRTRLVGPGRRLGGLAAPRWLRDVMSSSLNTPTTQSR